MIKPATSIFILLSLLPACGPLSTGVTPYEEAVTTVPPKTEPKQNPTSNNDPLLFVLTPFNFEFDTMGQKASSTNFTLLEVSESAYSQVAQGGNYQLQMETSLGRGEP